MSSAKFNKVVKGSRTQHDVWVKIRIKEGLILKLQCCFPHNIGLILLLRERSPKHQLPKVQRQSRSEAG